MGLKSSKGINLIKKEVKVKKSVKKEIRSWSWLYIAFIMMVTVVAILVFLSGRYFDQEVEMKQREVIQYANRNINVARKDLLYQKVNLINKRFMLYQEVKDKKVDFIKFNQELNQLYPGIVVRKIDLRYGEKYSEAELMIPYEAYDRVSEFLSALKNSRVFEGSEVSSIIFSSANGVEAAEVKLSIQNQTDELNN